MHLAHLEEESAGRDKDEGSDDPDRINRVTKEFMVHLARAIKDAQREKCCYYCSSLEQRKTPVKQQGGDGIKEGSPDPSDNSYHTEEPPDGGSQGIKPPQQTPFLNPNPFQCWHGVKNVARVRINGKSCMALLDNGVQINTIMLKYISDHSLQIGPITNLLGKSYLCGVG